MSQVVSQGARISVANIRLRDRIKHSYAQVEELSLDMTPAMTDIYGCLVELLDACMKELRKSNKVQTQAKSTCRP